jgi:hypothetical protein
MEEEIRYWPDKFAAYAHGYEDGRSGSVIAVALGVLAGGACVGFFWWIFG